MRDRLRFIGSLLLLTPLARLWGSAAAWGENPERARRLNKEGERLLERGKYVKAITVFKKMHAACNGREYCTAVATFYLGRCRLEMGEYDEALKHLAEAEKTFERIKEENAKATVLHVKARILAEKGSFRESLNLFDKAGTVFTKFKNHEALFEMLNCAAVIHAYLGFYDKCLECLKAAGKLLPAAPDPGNAALLHNNMGFAQLGHRDYKDAGESFRKALDKFKKVDGWKGIATVHNNIGYAQEARSEYSAALKSHSESLRIAARIGDPRTQAEALNNLGTVSLRTGDVKQAQRSYERSLSIANTRGMKHFYGEILNNLGLVRIVYGNYSHAVRDFAESYRVSEELGVLPAQAWALHNLAFVFKDQGRWKDAGTLVAKALSLAETIGDPRLKAAATLRQGALREYLGLFDEANAGFLVAEKIQREIDDRYFQSFALSDIATSLVRKGRHREARKKFEEAIALRRSIGVPHPDISCRFALFYLEKHRYPDRATRSPHVKQTAPETRLHDLEAAERHLKHAEDTVQPENLHDGFLLMYVKARRLLETDPIKSLEGFNGLKERAQASRIGKYVFLATVGVGLAQERLNKWTEAQKAFSEAAEYVGRIQKTLDSTEHASFLQGEQILGLKNGAAYEGLTRVEKAQA